MNILAFVYVHMITIIAFVMLTSLQTGLMKPIDIGVNEIPSWLVLPIAYPISTALVFYTLSIAVVVLMGRKSAILNSTNQINDEKN